MKQCETRKANTPARAIGTQGCCNPSFFYANKYVTERNLEKGGEGGAVRTNDKYQ